MPLLAKDPTDLSLDRGLCCLGSSPDAVMELPGNCGWRLTWLTLTGSDLDLWADAGVCSQTCFVTRNLPEDVGSWVNLAVTCGTALLTLLRYRGLCWVCYQAGLLSPSPCKDC